MADFELSEIEENHRFFDEDDPGTTGLIIGRAAKCDLGLFGKPQVAHVDKDGLLRVINGASKINGDKIKISPYLGIEYILLPNKIENPEEMLVDLKGNRPALWRPYFDLRKYPSLHEALKNAKSFDGRERITIYGFTFASEMEENHHKKYNLAYILDQDKNFAFDVPIFLHLMDVALVNPNYKP